MSSTTTTRTPTLDAYDLGGLNCPLCENAGYVFRVENGIMTAKECECMNARRSLRRIRKSGLDNLLRRYSFKSYQAPDRERAKLKKKALEYCAAPGGWFFIGGAPGSGKTHLCTAICAELIDRGADARYCLWRDFTTAAKAVVNERESYAALVEPLKRVQVLYIDDFFKGTVSDADINLAFELLNARYNDTRLRTILSSERGINDILSIDEATGSRICERCRGFCLGAPDKNWRL